MRSSLIGKIEKAKRYAQEPQRVQFSQFTLRFQGEHNTYEVRFNAGQWHCGCPFFSQNGLCSHTMALEKLLGEMLPKLP